MCFGTTLATVEEVPLDVIEDGEPCATSRVGDGLSVSAGRAFFNDASFQTTISNDD